MISNQNTQLSQNGVYVHRKAYDNSLPIQVLISIICCLLGFHCPSAFLQTGSQLLDHKSPLPMDFFYRKDNSIEYKIPELHILCPRTLKALPASNAVCCSKEEPRRRPCLPLTLLPHPRSCLAFSLDSVFSLGS